MGKEEDLERIRKQGDKAQDYFSKLPGFEPAKWQPTPPPSPEAAAEEVQPAVPAKPQAPLSEAEKYFKKLLG